MTVPLLSAGMERAEVWQVLQDKAVELLEVPADDVQESRAFDELDVDSLSFVELVMDLEDAFDVELPEDELAGVRTFGALVDLIAARAHD